MIQSSPGALLFLDWCSVPLHLGARNYRITGSCSWSAPSSRKMAVGRVSTVVKVLVLALLSYTLYCPVTACGRVSTLELVKCSVMCCYELVLLTVASWLTQTLFLSNWNAIKSEYSIVIVIRRCFQEVFFWVELCCGYLLVSWSCSVLNSQGHDATTDSHASSLRHIRFILSDVQILTCESRGSPPLRSCGRNCAVTLLFPSIWGTVKVTHTRSCTCLWLKRGAFAILWSKSATTHAAQSGFQSL